MTWDTNSSGVPRDEAKRLIVEKAKEDGIQGAFKVFYEGALVANPDNLPETVDMSQIEVSAVLDQA